MDIQPRVDKNFVEPYKLSDLLSVLAEEAPSLLAEEAPDTPMTDGTQTKAWVIIRYSDIQDLHFCAAKINVHTLLSLKMKPKTM